MSSTIDGVGSTGNSITDTSWEGRALATTDVALTNSIITGCESALAPPAVREIPTLGLGGVASLVVLLAGMGLLVLRRLSV